MAARQLGHLCTRADLQQAYGAFTAVAVAIGNRFGSGIATA